MTPVCLNNFQGNIFYIQMKILKQLNNRYPDCRYQGGLSGELLESPRKIILMVIFSFEVDTLEVALKEQQDMVDMIFIVESSVAYKGVSKGIFLNLS